MNLDIAKDIYWSFYDYHSDFADLLSLCVSNAPSIAENFLRDFLNGLTPDEIREDFITYPAHYRVNKDELESFIKAEMTSQSENKCYIFSKVFITADNDTYTEFLASGIPNDENDLKIYEEYQSLLEDVPANSHLFVEVCTYSYGQGESENADFELLAELSNNEFEEQSETDIIQSFSFEIALKEE